MIGGTRVPLETDLTTPLAYLLQQVPKVSGLSAMLNPELYSFSRLIQLEPFAPDKIPVVFVHGLMSSPLTWARLFNDLLADPVLRRRYQFSFFRYATVNPILYSASLLRASLDEFRMKYDPAGTNPYVQNAVICGHSMGDLLTKLMLHTSGDRLWNLVSDQPFDEVVTDEEERELGRRLIFFEAHSFLRRAIFIAVPHRGSDFAAGWLGHLGAKLITLPSTLRGTGVRLVGRIRTRLGGEVDSNVIENEITGVRNLSSDNPTLNEVVTWEFPPELPLHSILGNTAGTTPDGTDGLVSYESSHIDGVRSEKIVHSGHSAHEHPEAILEVRRILHLHLQEFDRRQQAARAAK